MKKIKIGDKLKTNHGIAIVTGIELMPDKWVSEGGIEMNEIWETLKDYCVFSLDNGHWAYGDRSETVLS